MCPQRRRRLLRTARVSFLEDSFGAYGLLFAVIKQENERHLCLNLGGTTEKKGSSSLGL